MPSMISLTKSQVPEYLTKSAFYEGLFDDDDEFLIPLQNFKPSLDFVGSAELEHLFNTFKYWGIHKLPDQILELLIFKPDSFSKEVLLEFNAEFKLLEFNVSQSKCTDRKQRLENAIQCKVEDVLEYLYRVHNKTNSVLIKSVAAGGFVTLLERIHDNYLNLPNHKTPLASISMAAVASLGHVECLRFLLEKGCKKHKDTCKAAAENGHLACLQLAHERGCEYDKSVRNAAVSGGRLDCLKYTLAHNCPLDADTACVAAEKGQLECLQYVLDQGVAPTKRMNLWAVKGGSTECLQLLRARGAPVWDVQCTNKAASQGNLACLRFLLDEGCTVDSSTTDCAAAAGHDLCLELLLSRGCMDGSHNALVAAALKGHVSCLRVLKQFGVTLRDSYSSACGSIIFLRSLLEAGYPISEFLLRSIVAWGQEEAVEYICANNLCTLTVSLPRAAIFLCHSTNLQMLQILRKYKCPWDERTCQRAAEVGDIECLKFAHENGCPWDTRTTAAVMDVCFGPYNPPISVVECLKYAIEHGCPCARDPCVEAASRGLIDKLKFFHKHGCALTLETCVAAATYKYADCLTYAVTHGAPVDASICVAAVAVSAPVAPVPSWKGATEPAVTPLRMLQCARSLGCPWDEVTCRRAVECGELECLKLAHENGCPWDERTTSAAINVCFCEERPSLKVMKCLQYAVQHGCPLERDPCEIAAARGLLGKLKCLHEHGCALTLKTCIAAATYKYTDCLTYAVTHGAPVDVRICIAAVAVSAPVAPDLSWKGETEPAVTPLRMLQCARSLGCPWDEVTCQQAALSGELECLQFAHDNGCPWDECTTLTVITGHLQSEFIRPNTMKCLQYALRQGCPLKGMDPCAVAAGLGLLDKLKCLHEHGCALTLQTCAYAAGHKYMDCLVYAVTHGAPVDTRICAASIAAIDTVPILPIKSYGHPEPAVTPLRMLECARSLGCPWDEVACQVAAASGELECLQFAHDNGCPWDERTTSAAIGICFHDEDPPLTVMKCLRYAIEHGCPGARDPCVDATARGLIDKLKYFHENGCALTLETCIAAATNKFPECLTYAVQHGAPVDASICAAAVAPVAAPTFDINVHSDAEPAVTPLRMLECAHELGCPWDERTCAAAATHAYSSECLEYAHKHGCPWDASTPTTALCSDIFGNFAYALKHGCPGDVHACVAAAERGNLAALQLLHEHHVTWDESVSRAAAGSGCAATLRYCVETCCPIDATTMKLYNTTQVIVL